MFNMDKALISFFNQRHLSTLRHKVTSCKFFITNPYTNLLYEALVVEMVVKRPFQLLRDILDY